MSLYPIIWALEHAPVIDAGERAVLMALANKGDFDGCNAYRGYPSIARVAKVDPKTVERKCHAMEKRGIIRRQPGPKPEGWLKLPGDKKTVVWEIMIPHSHYSAQQLANINESRAERGRPPITPELRPDLPEAPAKKARADKGKERPKKGAKERGDSESPRSEGTANPPARGLQVRSRGDSESPNPLMGPSDIPSSSSAEVEGITDVVAPTVEKRKIDKDRERAEALVGERLADHNPTADERHAVVDMVIVTESHKGREVNFLAPFIERRPLLMLERDLAEVRKYSAPPETTHCAVHDATMTAGTCVPCAGEIKAGDPEDIAKLQAHLDAVGPDVRPDLAGLLADRHRATRARTGDYWENQLRGERKARNGVVGGSRDPIPDHTYWANVTDEQLREML